MNLFITSSRGVYQYNVKDFSLSKIIGNWHKGFFRFPSKGFFGTCLSTTYKELVFVSRENFTKTSYKKSSDIIVHFYNYTNNRIIKKINIKNLYDVHQITSYKNLIFITETGKNRIQVLNTKTGYIQFFINIGNIRDDINHINAINIDNNFLYIGLNNGHEKNIFQNAQLIKIPTPQILKMKTINALNVGLLENLHGVYHTHDFEKFDNDYLISSSNLGKIYSYNQKKFITNINPWTRGITVSKSHIYIGKSGMGKRKSRHSRYYNGEIFVLDKSNFKIAKKIVIPKIGQLNDIIYIED